MRPQLPRKGLLAAAAAAAVLVAVAAAVIGRDLIDSSDSSKPAERKSRGFVRFRDPAAGFSISYPRSWRRLPPGEDQVRLIVAGGGASLLVRTSALGINVSPANVREAKKISDRLVRTVKQVKLLRRAQKVQLGGVPGYLYLYTFKDAGTGERGAHAHYFLFQGQTMFVLVFQALPSTTFAGLAPLFDRIGNTFRTQQAAAGP